MNLCNEKVTALKVCVDELQSRNESRLDRLERMSLEKDLVISVISKITTIHSQSWVIYVER